VKHKSFSIALCVLIGILTVPISAKRLSKDEIKKIISAASLQKGKYKTSVKISKKNKRKNTKKADTKVSKQPTQKSTKRMASVTPATPKKKPEEILPFQLTPSFENADVKIGQKGFKLIKGEVSEKKTNPLYKL